jgi:hypothetical protein
VKCTIVSRCRRQLSLAQIGEKFEHFLETYRRADGSKWGGQDLHNATGGVVTRSYVTSLRKGRIDNPGYDKLLGR